MTQIIFIPGAWHQPFHYSPLIAALGRHNLIVDSKPHLSTGANATVSQDAENARELILSHVEAGREVILMAHSFGGCVGGFAGSGLSKSQRQREGKKGGIIGCIWLAAHVVQQNKSLMDGLYLEELKLSDKLTPPMISILYNQCSEEVKQVAIPTLKGQSSLSLTTTADLPPIWQDCPRAFLLCRQDLAIPTKLTLEQLENSGVDWDVKEIDSDHSPHVSHTEETAQWAAAKIKAFAGK